MSNRNGSKWIRRDKRLAIYLRDDFTCRYCGEQLKSNQLTLDHVIPRTIKLDNSSTNLVTCCKTCNSKKQDAIIPIAPIKTTLTPYRKMAKEILSQKRPFSLILVSLTD